MLCSDVVGSFKFLYFPSIVQVHKINDEKTCMCDGSFSLSFCHTARTMRKSAHIPRYQSMKINDDLKKQSIVNACYQCHNNDFNEIRTIQLTSSKSLNSHGSQCRFTKHPHAPPCASYQ